MSYKFSSVFFLSIFILAACDSWPVVQSQIPWSADGANIDCVQQAVVSTPKVEFKSRESLSPNALCDGNNCEVRRQEITYLVPHNSKNQIARISLVEYKNASMKITHSAYGYNHQKFDEEDRKGFIEAQNAINSNIQKFCPGVGTPTEPR